MTLDPLNRWRLVLGRASESAIGGLDGQAQAMDDALAWLYRREDEREARGIQERGAGDGDAVLAIPEWIDQVHRLFPRETIERLERDAVERYQIDEIVTRPEVLQRVRPSESLLRAVLRTKHLMNAEVLALARELVRRVVQALLDRLRTEIRLAFHGKRNRQRHVPRSSHASFDVKTTLAKNLHRYDPDARRVVIERAFFHARHQKHSERWQVILVVDQSGSMVGSVIHAAVTAACLWSIPGVDPHLIVFDTKVVDLTRDVTDPVEVLMRVQLGGGTDIGQAMAYAAQLVKQPRRAIVVLVTDFYEGSSTYSLTTEVRALVGQGTRVLGLAALDPEAVPAYDREMAQRVANAGAVVGAMTPGELAQFVAAAMAGGRPEAPR